MSLGSALNDLGAERHREVRRVLAELKHTRLVTLGLLAPLTQQQLDAAPNGAWSVGEVADHLIRVEAEVRRHVSLLIRLHEAGDRPEISWTLTSNNTAPAWIPQQLLPMLELPFSLFNWFMPRPLFNVLVRLPLVPFRAADWASPGHGRDGVTLCAELAAQIADTEVLLAANAACDYRTMVLRHPMLGVNNVPQLLTVLRNHERRHQEQIQRLIGAQPRARRL